MHQIKSKIPYYSLGITRLTWEHASRARPNAERAPIQLIASRVNQARPITAASVSTSVPTGFLPIRRLTANPAITRVKHAKVFDYQSLTTTTKS